MFWSYCSSRRRFTIRISNISPILTPTRTPNRTQTPSLPGLIRGGETCPFSSRFVSAHAAHPPGPGRRHPEPSLWLRMKPQSPSGLERNHPCPYPYVCSRLRLGPRARPMTLAKADETAGDGVRPLDNRRTDARPRSGLSDLFRAAR